MKILSLGAGVQSSTLAMMYAQGELEGMPDAAIFADTGWEPRKVHEYLDWLEKQLPFPVYRVMKDEGLLKAIQGAGRFAAVPFFTSNGGMGRRQCTNEFKILPIQRKVRELLGYRKYQRIPADAATMLIGISTDESIRMKPSRVAWIRHEWPLIDRNMSRQDCLEWFAARNFPKPPKSSCLGCPFHNDAQWLEIKNGDQQEWQETVAMDRHIRNRVTKRVNEQFMHRSLKPLDEVVFKGEDKANHFGNECEGMCGL
jgi:hypothetical protein